jgi:ABC-type amino acid transport substrate-binding protein
MKFAREGRAAAAAADAVVLRANYAAGGGKGKGKVVADSSGQVQEDLAMAAPPGEDDDTNYPSLAGE